MLLKIKVFKYILRLFKRDYYIVYGTKKDDVTFIKKNL